MEFNELKKIAINSSCLNRPDWKKFAKKNKNLYKKIIPSSPDKVYQEWISWKDFLGTRYDQKLKKTFKI